MLPLLWLEKKDFRQDEQDIQDYFFLWYPINPVHPV
jgi:hypothetical protein